ncbi:hypothetical protein B0F90DRAFT_1758782 [Multifurca ochricompacta]|uniref:Uncharacterized protein n=1 Tax=Multifurca ochricompacta TaxID=376703 RepID=A0AAD4LZS5_9AGAM|nr:hypothetical protein B0F90DRAFT_1758782 [Multifurca ochricompacta]
MTLLHYHRSMAACGHGVLYSTRLSWGGSCVLGGRFCQGFRQCHPPLSFTFVYTVCLSILLRR